MVLLDTRGGLNLANCGHRVASRLRVYRQRALNGQRSLCFQSNTCFWNITVLRATPVSSREIYDELGHRRRRSFPTRRRRNSKRNETVVRDRVRVLHTSEGPSFVGRTHRKSTHVPARFNIPYNVMKPLSAYGPEASN